MTPMPETPPIEVPIEPVISALTETIGAQALEIAKLRALLGAMTEDDGDKPDPTDPAA